MGRHFFIRCYGLHNLQTKVNGIQSLLLLYGRQPIFPSSIQHLDEEPLKHVPENLELELVHRSAILKQVMPLAMRNQAIAQECDKNRFRHVRGSGYARPKVKFRLGEYVLVKQSKDNTLQPLVRPHILRIGKLMDSGVVMLQGCDGATVKCQVHQLAHCSVPVSGHKIYLKRYVKTKSVYCEI